MLHQQRQSEAIQSIERKPTTPVVSVYLGKYTQQFLEGMAQSPVLSHWLLQDAYLHWAMTARSELPDDFSLRLIDWYFGIDITS